MRAPRASALAVLLLAAACSSPAEEEEPEQTASADAPTLQATVGTEESPDAFEIALVDENGDPVTELPAGDYNIVVNDFSEVHDFHLTSLSGGDVDERTGVSETGETTWVVTLDAGDYRYICDPHPSMNGSFTVT